MNTKSDFLTPEVKRKEKVYKNIYLVVIFALFTFINLIDNLKPQGTVVSYTKIFALVIPISFFYIASQILLKKKKPLSNLMANVVSFLVTAITLFSAMYLYKGYYNSFPDDLLKYGFIIIVVMFGIFYPVILQMYHYDIYEDEDFLINSRRMREFMLLCIMVVSIYVKENRKDVDYHDIFLIMGFIIIFLIDRLFAYATKERTAKQRYVISHIIFILEVIYVVYLYCDGSLFIKHSFEPSTTTIDMLMYGVVSLDISEYKFAIFGWFLILLFFKLITSISTNKKMRNAKNNANITEEIKANGCFDSLINFGLSVIGMCARMYTIQYFISIIFKIRI